MTTKPTFEEIQDELRKQLKYQIELNEKFQGENIRVRIEFKGIVTPLFFPTVLADEHFEFLVYEAAITIDNELRYKELTLQMRSQNDRMTHFLLGIRYDLFVLAHPEDYNLLRAKYASLKPKVFYADMQVLISYDTPKGKPRVVMALDEPAGYSQPTPITNN